MPVGISMEVKGLKQALKALNKVQSKLSKDYRKLWDRQIIVLQQIFDRRFKSQNKGRWTPLNPMTTQITRPHNPLLLSGTLRGSLGARNIHSIRDIKRNVLTYGTKYKPAGIQNEGAKVKVTDAMRNFFAAHNVFLSSKKKTIVIPKRAFMFLENEDEKRIRVVWESWGNEQIKVVVKSA